MGARWTIVHPSLPVFGSENCPLTFRSAIWTTDLKTQQVASPLTHLTLPPSECRYDTDACRTNYASNMHYHNRISLTIDKAQRFRSCGVIQQTYHINKSAQFCELFRLMICLLIVSRKSTSNVRSYFLPTASGGALHVLYDGRHSI